MTGSALAPACTTVSCRHASGDVRLIVTVFSRPGDDHWNPLYANASLPTLIVGRLKIFPVPTTDQQVLSTIG